MLCQNKVLHERVLIKSISMLIDKWKRPGGCIKYHSVDAERELNKYDTV